MPSRQPLDTYINRNFFVVTVVQETMYCSFPSTPDRLCYSLLWNGGVVAGFDGEAAAGALPGMLVLFFVTYHG